MAAISGQYALVKIGASSVAECQGFTWTRTCILHAYASCATGGFKKRVAGTRDGNGSINGVFNPDDAPEDYFDEGDAVTLLLYVDASSYYSVPAVIENLEISADIDDGAIMPWSASWGQNGAYSSSGV